MGRSKILYKFSYQLLHLLRHHTLNKFRQPACFFSPSGSDQQENKSKPWCSSLANFVLLRFGTREGEVVWQAPKYQIDKDRSEGWENELANYLDWFLDHRGRRNTQYFRLGYAMQNEVEELDLDFTLDNAKPCINFPHSLYTFNNGCLFGEWNPSWNTIKEIRFEQVDIIGGMKIKSSCLDMGMIRVIGEGQDFKFVDQLEHVVIDIINGGNELELAKYLVKHAKRMEQMIIYPPLLSHSTDKIVNEFRKITNATTIANAVKIRNPIVRFHVVEYCDDVLSCGFPWLDMSRTGQLYIESTSS
ncbi:hypothetical protein OIU79_031188 [Salix purpurea]|uniref:Uncharacterized protein n=1 Tax=Salix purpurea TaxID=77065 RepID=A0A9Q0VCB3_SALPP|nr:hypothetical protein OIU79_031188 [Salix purpurea]